MANRTKSHSHYDEQFFTNPFPPNHNPLIATPQQDTLHDVHAVLATLQELTMLTEQQQSEYVASGMFYIMECALHALRFEIQQRKR